MKPRLMLVGNWAWDIYEEALARGFIGHGWEVLPFRTGVVVGMPAEGSWRGRLRPGWALKSLNDALVEAALKARPELIFLWRCIDILPVTLSVLRSRLPDTTIISYHNDNPFRGVRERLRARHFLAGLRHAHIVAVYRPDNLAHARAYGAPRAELLLPSFIRELHRPLEGPPQVDVVYVGHYEADGRAQALLALHDAGVDVQVRGTGWNLAQQQHQWLAQQSVERLWGDAYVRTLANARICLAFLSRKHRDVYTRRCFEIPACGSMLMAPRTPELQKLFREDQEAVFWSTPEELIEKVRFFLANESARSRIASAGRQRVIEDGHDEYGRARQVISWVRSPDANWKRSSI